MWNQLSIADPDRLALDLGHVEHLGQRPPHSALPTNGPPIQLPMHCMVKTCRRMGRAVISA